MPASAGEPAAPARLSREHWVEAALSALAAGGPETIRVETLAKALGVTKGSFYWHFRDRDALLAALLEVWRDRRSAAIRAQIEAASGPPAARLRHLLDLYLDRANPRGMAIELAVRDWARRDPGAAAAVAAVDAERLRAVGGLFEAMGCPPAEAEARALAFYAFIFGQSLVLQEPSADAPGRRALLARLLIGPP